MGSGAGVAAAGAENVDSDCAPLLTAEDFAYMLQAKPGSYILIGNGVGERGGRSLHSSHYDFNDDVLALGAGYWTALVEQELAP